MKPGRLTGCRNWGPDRVGGKWPPRFCAGNAPPLFPYLDTIETISLKFRQLFFVSAVFVDFFLKKNFLLHIDKSVNLV